MTFLNNDKRLVPFAQLSQVHKIVFTSLVTGWTLFTRLHRACSSTQANNKNNSQFFILQQQCPVSLMLSRLNGSNSLQPSPNTLWKSFLEEECRLLSQSRVWLELFKWLIDALNRMVSAAYGLQAVSESLLDRWTLPRNLSNVRIGGPVSV